MSHQAIAKHTGITKHTAKHTGITKHTAKHTGITKHTAKHTGITAPQTIRTFTFISIMENKEFYHNILLDNQEHQLKLLYRALRK